MVLKVYISGMSGNKEVKKRQQRVLMILDSKNINYDVIDITEPGREGDKEFMQTKSSSNGATVSDPEPRHALPPQIFNEENYCGDYDAFDLANETDALDEFLKLVSAARTNDADGHAELITSYDQNIAKGKDIDDKPEENVENQPNGENITAAIVDNENDDKAELRQANSSSNANAELTYRINLAMKISINIVRNHEKTFNSRPSSLLTLLQEDQLKINSNTVNKSNIDLVSKTNN